jgi:hypothetical protein
MSIYIYRRGRGEVCHLMSAIAKRMSSLEGRKNGWKDVKKEGRLSRKEGRKALHPNQPPPPSPPSLQTNLRPTPPAM